VSAIPTVLGDIRSGHINRGNLGIRRNQRYVNTLMNFGLVDNSDLQITPLGEQILAFPQAQDISARTIAVDGVIFNGLFEQLLRGTPNNRALVFFLKILRQARDFLDAIPAGERRAVAEHEKSLLLLQIINSSGLEVPRLWQLDEKSRKAAMAALQNAYTSDAFPGSHPPKDESLTAYRYIAILRLNRIQADVRYRVRAFLTAYLDRQEQMGDTFSRIFELPVQDASPARATLTAPIEGRRSTKPVISPDLITVTEDVEGPSGALPREPAALPKASSAQISSDCPLIPPKPRTGATGKSIILKKRVSRRAKELGDWAEECVFKQLTGQQEEGKITALTWHAREGRKPGWDIEYKDLPSGTVKRIEVKGTTARIFQTFDLTANEFTMLQTFGADYALALVTRSGSADPKVFYLWNPAQWFAENRLACETQIWSVWTPLL